jgi:hypothetical protein
MQATSAPQASRDSNIVNINSMRKVSCSRNCDHLLAFVSTRRDDELCICFHFTRRKVMSYLRFEGAKRVELT